ncbi:MAG: outer membrane beta-barrel protein [Casimicrobiaceae bacterium]
MKIQILTALIACTAASIVFESARAHAQAPSPAVSGFYGGVSLRDGGTGGSGITYGHLTSTWNKFAPIIAEDDAPNSLAFGGYRWANDLRLEASVATADRYALSATGPTAQRGVGLTFAPENWNPRAWNIDVYTGWGFMKSLTLYGRMGYRQSEPAPGYAAFASSDVHRHNRDGVNYGVGLRYDMTPAFGLRLEYARFERQPGEAVTGVLPESDQVQFGLQLRF